MKMIGHDDPRSKRETDYAGPTVADELALVALMAPIWSERGDYDVLDWTCPQCGRWVDPYGLRVERIDRRCDSCRLDDLDGGDA